MSGPTFVNGIPRAPRDGHRPASEELWFCPSCGIPATAFVSFSRTVACGRCRWTFDVSLVRYIGGDDLYLSAQAHAEQIDVAEMPAVLAKRSARKLSTIRPGTKTSTNAKSRKRRMTKRDFVSDGNDGN